MPTATRSSPDVRQSAQPKSVWYERLTKAAAYSLPEIPIILAALIYTNSRGLQRSLGAIAFYYPYAMFGAGLLLGWRFHRSRLLFALLVLALVDRSLLAFVASHGFTRDHVAFQAIAFLLPLNLAALALTAVRAGNPGFSTFYFATSALILIIAVVEASYHMAYQDSLTQLPARRALNEALLRLGSQYTVGMVDVDHFKRINDSHGHDVGDQVLKMVAARLAQVGGGGRAYRYGGEEFAVIFPGKGAEECLPELEALRKVVEDAKFILRSRIRSKRKKEKILAEKGPGRRVPVTVSIGVAERDSRHSKPDQVVKAADRALYRAKDGGRNQVQM